MKKNICIILFFLIFVNKNSLAYEEDKKINTDIFSTISVLHEGRIKPLASFAKKTLYDISKQNKIDNLNSVDWLAELFFNYKKAYQRKVFFINDKNLLINLDLDANISSLYSLDQLFHAFRKRTNLVKSMQIVAQNKLNSSQIKMLDLYYKMLYVLSLSEIMEFILPNINEDNNKNISIYELTKIKKHVNLNEHVNVNKKIDIFLLPFSNKIWLNIEDAFLKNDFFSKTYLDLLSKAAISYLNDDQLKWNESWLLLKSISAEILINTHKTQLEIIYNKISPINLSMYFYFITFLISLYIIITQNKLNSTKYIIYTFYALGFTMHFTGVILRIIITARPPITSLYESIIFVNLALNILIFLLVKKLKYFSIIIITAGSLTSAILQYIGYKLDLDADTFRILMSVLNTNFWLITHVITISLGYTCCLISGLLGHICLVFYINVFKNAEILKKINKTLLILCIFALFFSLSGTILGGIWADQSWGRFWGWDPKENGALLIVLWLILILHTRIINFFSDMFFCIGMIFNTIIVAIAWFGVNLLNVGLHTYGFIQNIGQNLILFCSFELLYVLIVLFIFFIKNKQNQKKI